MVCREDLEGYVCREVAVVCCALWGVLVLSMSPGPWIKEEITLLDS